MEIVVCIKQVPGTSEVEMDENGNLIRDGLDSKMNPFDLFAIETAMKIKDNNDAIKIKVITMGPPQAKAVIKEAFMMGADEGILLTDRKFAGADVWATSYTLAQGIKKIGIPSLIICGKQTTDGDTAQVGAEIAEFLDIPHVTNVTKIIEVRGTSITVELDLPTMVQVAKLKFPCLITVEKDIYQPRLPSFKRKLATKNRKITKYSFLDFEDKNLNHYGGVGSPTKVQKIFPPESNNEKIMLSGSSEELANKIFIKLKEAKFI